MTRSGEGIDSVELAFLRAVHTAAKNVIANREQDAGLEPNYILATVRVASMNTLQALLETRP